MLYAGRFILGAGVAIEGGCVGIFISKCVPPALRSNLVSIYQLMIAFGEVIGYADGGVFSGVPKGNWRWMLGSYILFSTILLIGMCFLPESPRLLMVKGKNCRAWSVYKSLRDIDHRRYQIEWVLIEHTVAFDSARATTK